MHRSTEVHPHVCTHVPAHVSALVYVHAYTQVCAAENAMYTHMSSQISTSIYVQKITCTSMMQNMPADMLVPGAR